MTWRHKVSRRLTLLFGATTVAAMVVGSCEKPARLTAPTGVVAQNDTCTTSSVTWQNTAFATQSGSFTAAVDATPNVADMDGGTGLGAGTAAGVKDLAAIRPFAA